ncbi:putative transposase [Bradyrhizobium sp. Gha]|nr:putative transposase [Bradyrhizobium sp. Gha]
MTHARTIDPVMITFLVATSEVAVAAFITEHPANCSAAHPSIAKHSMDRAFGPINRTLHTGSGAGLVRWRTSAADPGSAGDLLQLEEEVVWRSAARREAPAEADRGGERQAEETGRRSAARQGCCRRDPPKAMKPGRKRKLLDEVRSEWQVSMRRACDALEFDHVTYHYKSCRSGQAALEQKIS